MEKLIEFLKSDIMMSFYVKYAICFIASEVTTIRLLYLASDLGYARNKKTLGERIKGTFCTALLFVPYVGWGLTVLALLGCFTTEGDINIVTKSGKYHKI